MRKQQFSMLMRRFYANFIHTIGIVDKHDTTERLVALHINQLSLLLVKKDIPILSLTLSLIRN